MKTKSAKEQHEFFNPLLYFPEFVEKPVRPSTPGVILAQDSTLFTPTAAMLLVARNHIPLYGSAEFNNQPPVAIARSVTRWLDSHTVYDDEREHPGFRDAERTFNDKKGSCFEHAALLYSILKSAGQDPQWVLTRNNVKCLFDGPFDVGIHPFLRVTQDGKNYFMDVQSGVLDENSISQISAASSELSENQMKSYLFGDGAEDLLMRGKSLDALVGSDHSLSVDPNNYTTHVLRAEIFKAMKEDGAARASFNKAICIAPDCGDIDKVRGDFLLFYDRDEDSAIKSYKTALGKQSKDPFLYLDMARRLRALGKAKLARKADATFVKIGNSMGTSKYLENLIDTIPVEIASDRGEVLLYQAELYDKFKAAYNLFPESAAPFVETERAYRAESAAAHVKKSAIARIRKRLKQFS